MVTWNVLKFTSMTIPIDEDSLIARAMTDLRLSIKSRSKAVLAATTWTVLLNVTCTRYECEVVLIVVVVVEIGESMNVWLLNEKLKPRCAISASKFTIVSGSTRETEIVLATTSKLTTILRVVVLTALAIATISCDVNAVSIELSVKIVATVAFIERRTED